MSRNHPNKLNPLYQLYLKLEQISYQNQLSNNYYTKVNLNEKFNHFYVNDIDKLHHIPLQNIRRIQFNLNSMMKFIFNLKLEIFKFNCFTLLRGSSFHRNLSIIHLLKISFSHSKYVHDQIQKSSWRIFVLLLPNFIIEFDQKYMTLQKALDEVFFNLSRCFSFFINLMFKIISFPLML